MGKYYIHESNMDRLAKRLTRIQNKCNKYNLSFKFETIGEEYRRVELQDGTSAVQKYIVVETEGSLHHENWQFIGVVNHRKFGNVIRQLVTVAEVPEKYRFSQPICEHCNTRRNRKDTYLIRNTETGEWKQVGKSCLCEFTRGLDAEDAARYISLFDTLIKGESFDTSSGFKKYYNVSEILSYAFETVKHFGYQPANEDNPRPTKLRCMQYYRGEDAECGSIKDEMIEVNFDGLSDENISLAKGAINWVNGQNDIGSNSYMHNLKVICSSDYCSSSDLGILISLAHVYRKHLKTQQMLSDKQARCRIESENSKYVGQIGDRVKFNTTDVECVYSNSNQFGVTFMYKLIDKDSNVYMWSTSTYLEDNKNYIITGKVKSHETFRGIKQTWITRCKAVQIIGGNEHE